MTRLASLKVLTSQLYQVSSEQSTVSTDISASLVVTEPPVDWIDEIFATKEEATTEKQSKTIFPEVLQASITAILQENIPPQACSLETLQNELDCKSKKFVVKTAEMKHRRGKSTKQFWFFLNLIFFKIIN